MKLIRSIVINCLLIGLVFTAVTVFQQRNLLKADTTPAPYFNLPLLDNTQQRLSIAELKGNTTVVYFFAPWCSICRYSMPNLQAAIADTSTRAIGIALDYQSEKEVKAFVKDLDLDFPILLGNQQIQANYKVTAFPTYYVINKNMQITARSMGYSSELGISLRVN